MSQELLIKDTNIKKAVVEVKTVKIGKNKLTKNLFLQIPIENENYNRIASLIDNDEVLGRVNLTQGKDNSMWVLWSDNGVLKRTELKPFNLGLFCGGIKQYTEMRGILQNRVIDTILLGVFKASKTADGDVHYSFNHKDKNVLIWVKQDNGILIAMDSDYESVEEPINDYKDVIKDGLKKVDSFIQLMELDQIYIGA